LTSAPIFASRRRLRLVAYADLGGRCLEGDCQAVCPQNDQF
jgi:hypothetical protein